MEAWQEERIIRESLMKGINLCSTLRVIEQRMSSGGGGAKTGVLICWLLHMDSEMEEDIIAINFLIRFIDLLDRMESSFL